MKKIILILISTIIMGNQIDGAVKTFVNNAPKDFLVRVYYGKNSIMGLTLQPGEIQDLFIPCDIINSIVVLDHKQSSKPLSSLTRNELRKETVAVNENDIFIINKNSSINMYKGASSRDRVLDQINDAYTKKTNLPTIDLSIHTIKTDQPWITQKIVYNLKHKTSFIGSVESLFS